MRLNEHLATADRSVRHDLQARPFHDAVAREAYVHSLKHEVRREFETGQRTLYDRKIEPEFRRKKGQPPRSIDDIRSAMRGDGFHQMWGALTFTGQELLWDAVASRIEGDLPRIEALARGYRQSNRKLGSLMLNPQIAVPAYAGHVDLGGQPGGWGLSETDDDIYAGALQDAGNADAGSKALTAIGHLRREFPDFAPSRILDIGCGAGGSTLPYAEAFPGAEVYGIDVGAGLLRYAHGRAENLGRAVHFAQQNGEKTTYPTGFFDLIVSHDLFHASSRSATRAILREAKRLLRPGGLFLNLDRASEKDDLFRRYLEDWQTENAAQPCWRSFAAMDWKAELADAGFTADAVFVTPVEADADGHRRILFGATR